jgi:polyisoprenoid-binding protein YceI
VKINNGGNMKFMQLMLLVALFVTNAMAAEVDTKSSVLKWTGKKVTGKHFGKIYYKSGKAEVKEGKLVGGEFVVDMNSFTVDDLEGTWAQKFIGHMKSPDFFTVEKYPTATLKIKKADGNKVTADLTIKGKTNPVTFTYKKDGEAFVGNFKFDRTKYDMVYNSGNFFKDLGDKMIEDEVAVEFKLVLK